MTQPTPHEAFNVLCQALAVVPTNKWADRELTVDMVRIVRAALLERDELLSKAADKPTAKSNS